MTVSGSSGGAWPISYTARWPDMDATIIVRFRHSLITRLYTAELPHPGGTGMVCKRVPAREQGRSLSGSKASKTACQ
jgi:hypothetical protein